MMMLVMMMMTMKQCYWSNVQVAVWLSGLVLVVMTSWIDALPIGPERYEDMSFPRENLILNQKVTCGDNKPSRFIARTYTCNHVRVNGRRLAYGYYSGWAVGMDERRCQETSGVHEFGKLCQLLLESIHKDSMGLRAIYVPNSFCGYVNETRKLLKKIGDDTFEWKDFPSGWGWTDTLQCMTAS